MKLLVSVLGETDYLKVLSIQESLLRLRQDNKVPDTMLLLQHPPTITLGKRENRENILLTEEQLQEKGCVVVKTNRGGDVTYHGPGQIVGYPILNLKNHGSSIKGYVNKIEELFINLLKEEYKLTAQRDALHHGVWIGDKKITAIGCAVKKWVTMHGFAFNVNTNLEHFKWINPCGITDKGVTSLKEIFGQAQDLDRAHQLVVDYFCEYLHLQPKMISPQQLYQIVGRDGS
ncbi:lipoyl(octanoyl) transferase LipB [Desulfofalx alkaliphila]|uniref:lipoyl(octanoyl) transferase LipB n=1 Tax=Desulfofalx alkaliphila TaxID=105483 RepID=UPI0004E1E408|nr:lipoyl(octanoyl) transferase LipB [Desulfofalx alkaliphila]